MAVGNQIFLLEKKSSFLSADKKTICQDRMTFSETIKNSILAGLKLTEKKR